MSYDPLNPIDPSEFVKLANAAGFEILDEDLPQLVRRNLIKPLNVEGEDRYTAAHLYVLAQYFDAVRVYRHPWTMRASDKTLDDVKKTANTVGNIIEAVRMGETDDDLATDIGELVIELERYLMSVEPFGPIGTIVDFMHPNVRRQLRRQGRLTVELRNVASRLAMAADGDTPDVAPTTQELPEAEEEAPQAIEGDVKTTMEAAAIDRRNVPPATQHPRPVTTRKMPPAKTIPSIKTPPVVKAKVEEQKETEPTNAPTTPPEKAKPPKAAAKPPVAAKPPAAAAKPPAAAAKPPVAAEPAEPEEVVDDFDEGEDSAPTALIELPSPPEAEEKEAPTPEADEEEPAEEDSAAEESADDEAAEQEPVEEPKKEKANEFDRTEKTGRTKSLMARLSEIRDRKAPEAKSDEAAEDIASQVEELNKLRETLFKEQRWKELAELYEERIDLFEDPDQVQQIYFALATIYEAKLKKPRRAFENFVFAFEASENNRERAFEGIQRLGRKPDMTNSFQSWLEDQSNREISAELKAKIKSEIARDLAKTGEHQRAFLTLAATLLNDPNAIDNAVLDQMEEMTLNIGDEDLDTFFNDVLEHDDLDTEVQERVAIRAANSYMSRNQNLHAIRYFRLALDAKPDNELAFANLARLYQAEGSWTDLVELAWERMSDDPSDKEIASLASAVEGDVKEDPERLGHYAERFESEPDSRPALEAAVAAYVAADKAAEAYGLLNRVLENVNEKATRAALLLHLSAIANDHLHAPEEAQVHLERALESGGPSPAILGELAKVHMATGDYMNAVSTLESLTLNGMALEDEAKIDLLAMGIEAASKAHRGEEREKFVSELRRLSPHHEALKS